MSLHVSLSAPPPPPRPARHHRIPVSIAFNSSLALRPPPPGAPAATCPWPNRRHATPLPLRPPPAPPFSSCRLVIPACLPAGCWLATVSSAAVRVYSVMRRARHSTAQHRGPGIVTYLLRAYVRMLCLRLHRRHLALPCPVPAPLAAGGDAADVAEHGLPALPPRPRPPNHWLPRRLVTLTPRAFLQVPRS